MKTANRSRRKGAFNGRWRPSAWLLGLGLLGGLLNAALNPQSPPWPTPGELAEGEVALATIEGWSSSPLWVDARDQPDSDDSRLPAAVRDHAIHLPLRELDERVERLLVAWEPGARIVVYCDSADCGASTEVARALRETYGLPDVWVLAGGLDAWGDASR